MNGLFIIKVILNYQKLKIIEAFIHKEDAIVILLKLKYDDYKKKENIFFFIAMTLDLPSILNFCTTSKRFNKQVCLNKKFWIFRLRKDYHGSYNFKPKDEKIL